MLSAKENLTVIILSYNEEKRIQQTIDNYKFKFNILVLDNFSTDQTITICNKNQVEFIQIKNKGHLDSKVISDVIKLIKTDWVFFVQCSEYSPKKLIQEIKLNITNKNIRAILFNRVSFTGGVITHNLNKVYKKQNDKYVFTRLFNKNYIQLSKSKIHFEFPILIEQPDQVFELNDSIDESLYHFRVIDIDGGDKKHINYSKFDAEQMFKDGRRGSYLRVILRPVKSIFFFLNFKIFFNFDYYNFITIIQHFQYILSVELRLLEMTKFESIDSCNHKNRKILEKLVSSDL